MKWILPSAARNESRHWTDICLEGSCSGNTRENTREALGESDQPSASLSTWTRLRHRGRRTHCDSSAVSRTGTVRSSREPAPVLSLSLSSAYTSSFSSSLRSQGRRQGPRRPSRLRCPARSRSYCCSHRRSSLDPLCRKAERASPLPLSRSV